MWSSSPESGQRSCDCRLMLQLSSCTRGMSSSIRFCTMAWSLSTLWASTGLEPSASTLIGRSGARNYVFFGVDVQRCVFGMLCFCCRCLLSERKRWPVPLAKGNSHMPRVQSIRPLRHSARRPRTYIYVVYRYMYLYFYPYWYAGWRFAFLHIVCSACVACISYAVSRM